MSPFISTAWDYAINWVWGWGGASALLSIACFALYLLVPSIPWFDNIRTTVLNVAIGAAVFCGASTYFYKDGFTNGRAECKAEWDAANKRAEQEAKQRDADIAADRERYKDEAIAQIKGENDDLIKQVEDFNKSHEGRTCNLTGDDVRRLSPVR